MKRFLHLQLVLALLSLFCHRAWGSDTRPMKIKEFLLIVLLGILLVSGLSCDGGKPTTTTPTVTPSPSATVTTASSQCGTEIDDCSCGSDNKCVCCDNNNDGDSDDEYDGNCVWWAWQQACCKWGVTLERCPDANTWVSEAQDENYPVSNTPAVDTIAVKTSGTYGHVAWVVGVDEDTITVTEMNCCRVAPSLCTRSGENSTHCQTCGPENPNCSDAGTSVRSCSYTKGYFDKYIYPKNDVASPTPTHTPTTTPTSTCDINDLTMRLEECMNKLASQSPFHAEPYDSQEITNAIIGVVADARVQLVSLDHEGQSDLQLGATTYAVDSYHLVCSVDEGKGSSLIVLLELFEELREERYATLLIQNVQLPASKTEISFDIGLVTQ